MNQLLEINIECPVSANDLIRANPGIHWHISPGIGQGNIGRVVADVLLSAVEGCECQPGGEGAVGNDSGT